MSGDWTTARASLFAIGERSSVGVEGFDSAGSGSGCRTFAGDTDFTAADTVEYTLCCDELRGDTLGAGGGAGVWGACVITRLNSWGNSRNV